ncbi:MAG: HAD family hydrolase [Halodesulfovibrio sp.]
MYVTAHNLRDAYPDGITGIIFDCDGVMFDTRECNVQYYNLILSRMGLDPMTKEEEDFVHVATVVQSLEYIVPRSRWNELPEARKAVNYVQEIMPHMRPEPGLFEFLETLRSMNLRMAVYTNRTNTMELVLERWGISSFFFPVMTAQKVKGKPHPEGAFKILEAWGAKPSDVAFIGDSTADQRAAEASGIPFWAFKNESLLAQRHVPDFWSLRRALIQWGEESCSR